MRLVVWTPDDAKRAYRKLARKYHPDVSKEADAEARFKQLRLPGQGGPGLGNAPAGDLYLEVAFRPHPRYRVDGRDVLIDLPLAPWEAALGASVTVPTPQDDVELRVPAGSRDNLIEFF